MYLSLNTLFLVIISSAVSFGATYLNKNDAPLSSKVIFQSPTVENVYKDIILSSKPINLKKYATAKPKHSLNDSKIYYIPIGPMPYQFSHPPGYNYQPFRVNPGGINGNKQPVSVPPTNQVFNGPNVPPNFLQAFLQSFQQNPQNFLPKVPQQNKQPIVPHQVRPQYYRPGNIVPQMIPQIVPQNIPQQNVPQMNQQIVPHQQVAQHNVPQYIPQSAPLNIPQQVPQITPNGHPTPAPVTAAGPADTVMTRLNGHAYYFNGRPFNLKAYRASPKLNVDKHNLQSHLFFNKNIIY